MTTTIDLQLVAGGEVIADVLPLRESNDALDDAAELRRRIGEEGYLFIRGGLDRQQVLEARREMLTRLAAAGVLEEGCDVMEGRLRPGKAQAFSPELAKDNGPLMRVLYDGAMMDLMGKLVGGAVRHFDFTWVRTVAPGPGTKCHADSVYMNRGTHDLYTAWTPMGDIDYRLGGLVVLEGSHKHAKLKQTYSMQDVDSFCENQPEARSWGKSWGTGGWLKGGLNQIARSIGGQWRSAEYRAGDVLVFSIFTLHASLDNRSDRLRLSTDTRYQNADEPADERWIGPSPIGHSTAAQRGRIF